MDYSLARRIGMVLLAYPAALLLMICFAPILAGLAAVHIANRFTTTLPHIRDPYHKKTII
jgi:hypothetical protein